MADEKQVELLKRSVKKWNLRMEQQPFEVDLENADLSGLDLNGANLREANLNGANLKGTKLEGADLVEARLKRANLERAHLTRANLKKANLSSKHSGILPEEFFPKGAPTNLKLATLKGAIIQNADLEGSSLEGANLEGADLRGARLIGANFSTYVSGSNLLDAVFKNTNLRGARLNFANLRGADLAGALLERASLEGAKMDGAKLLGADLKETDLTVMSELLLDASDIARVRIGRRPLIPYFQLCQLYTGNRFLVILALSVLALSPYVLEAMMWRATGQVAAAASNLELLDETEPMRILSLVTGWKDGAVQFSLTVVLLIYNVLRVFVTMRMGDLRHAQELSDISPRLGEYIWLWRVHKYFLRWVFFAAMAIATWKVGLLLWEEIPVPVDLSRDTP